jgi:hypothetical protein
LSLEPVGSFKTMGYKVLGYVVWHGGKWYARRRLPGAAPKLALAGLASVAVAGGALAAQRRFAAD